MADVLGGGSSLNRQYLPLAPSNGQYVKYVDGKAVWAAETPGGVVTEAGANAANEIGAATGATTALKLANLTSPATTTQQGVNLLGASGGAAKLTKMPDGAAPVYVQDDFTTVDLWIVVSSGALSVASTVGALRYTRDSTSGVCGFQRTLSQSFAAKIVVVKYRTSSLSIAPFTMHYNTTAKIIGTLSNSTTWAVAALLVPAYTDVNALWFRSASGSSGDWIEIDSIWIGDYSYLPGSLSEEAARIADQLGDTAGVGVAASGRITSDGTDVTANDYVDVFGKRYTWVEALSVTRVEGEVLKSGTAYGSLLNLWRAITRASGYDYNEATPRYNCAAAHPLITATSPSVGGPWFVVCTALTPGEQGNNITLAKSAASLTLSGATLTGGVSAGAAKIAGLAAPIIAGNGTRPAAAKMELTNTALIGYEATIDVASGGTFTLPAGGTWYWNVYGYGATISSAKRGSSAGGTTLTVAGANASISYRRVA